MAVILKTENHKNKKYEEQMNKNKVVHGEINPKRKKGRPEKKNKKNIAIERTTCWIQMAVPKEKEIHKLEWHGLRKTWGLRYISGSQLAGW